MEETKSDIPQGNDVPLETSQKKPQPVLQSHLYQVELKKWNLHRK